jgi:nucleotide-binding universal stress UspA family protein
MIRMEKQKKILVAYDGSPHSKSALDWAIRLGEDVGAELELVKVFEPIVRQYTRGDYNITEKIAAQFAEMEKTDRQMMEDAKHFCEGVCKLKVAVSVLKGNVTSTLLDYAEKADADLIVTGTKGHGVLEEMLVGSVTNKLVSLSKLPILVVKDQHESTKTSLKKIAVAYDGSVYSKAALGLALDMAKSANAEVVAVKVIDSLEIARIYSKAETGSMTKMLEQDPVNQAMIAEAQAIASEKGITLSVALLMGESVTATLIDFVEKNGVNMIVAGTLGHPLLDQILIGSVTRNLISVSKVPVLVVKQ